MTKEEILQIAKPVLFNTDMTIAILEDRKSVTRRLMKPQPAYHEYIDVGRCWEWFDAIWGEGINHYRPNQESEAYKRMRYKPGDYLYVRETWCNINKPGCKPDYYYYADTRICEDYDSTEWKWRPSIHMPKDAARIFLRVTDVWAEPLQNISITDLKKEGIECIGFPGKYPALKKRDIACKFVDIWDSTIPKKDLDEYGWEANPWVFVNQFERVEV